MRLDLVQDFVRLPLSPQEVVFAPVIEVAHRPPETGFEGSSDEYRVVAAADVVLVRRERRNWELQIVVVRLVDLIQELAIVFLFQLQVPIFIFRVGQVLC